MKKQFFKKSTLFVILALAGIMMVSCQKDKNEIIPQSSVELKDIPATLENFETTIESQAISSEMQYKKGRKVPSFSTLKVALAKTGLMSYVAQEEITIFAPSDEAFAALGITKQNVGEVENLTEILLYHVVAGKVYSTDLTNGFVETLNGAFVEVNLEDGVFVNDAEVIYANINARNGVIHVIDAVLFPPFMNLVEKAVSYNPDQFNTLVAAVSEFPGIVDLLSNGTYTVFAPTDEAFAVLGIYPNNVASVENLDAILAYHVVEGKVFSSDLTSGPVTTLNGEFIVNVENLTIQDNSPNLANLIESLLNVQATNGVIHVIDKVLIPFPPLP